MQVSGQLLLAGIQIPCMNSIELPGKVKEEYPEPIVIIIAAHGSADTAVNAMKMRAACDYPQKAFKPEQLFLTIETRGELSIY